MSDTRDIRSATPRRFWWWLADNRHFVAAALMLLPAAHFLGLQLARERFPSLDSYTLIRMPNSWQPMMLVLIWVGAFAYFLLSGVTSRRRSRLNRRRQNALHLKVDERRHLRGRDDDIEFYKKLCQEHRLIFLQGESGSGKSAFLAAGLYLELRTAPGELLLPILVDSWGDDWESGPFLQLAQAITREMTPALYQAIEYKEPISYKDVKDVLIALRQRANRLPLLLFDQFDDYQARHLDKFVVNGRSINDEELTSRNLFWREIRDLVVTSRVHCLFALRTDNRAGIVAVQFFHRPEVHYLSRLSGDHVTPLLEELTSAAPHEEPVIFEPERGWHVLQRRLLKDLASDGLVLPVQLKTALRALEQLPSLTVTEYQRVGGLIGLERTHVGLSIRTAARVAELPERTLALLLHCLIDPEHEPRKTRALTLDEMLSAAQAQGLAVARDQLERALQHLRAKDLVRQPLATEQAPRWRLDHDYLCQAVEEVVRGFDPGLERAAEWYQAYQTASGWQRLREAVRVPAGNLFVASLRGRIPDRKTASFVRTRGLGWIATVLILVMGIGMWIHAQQQEATARKLLESGSYFELARASEAVQRRCVDLGLKDDRLGTKLLEPRWVLRSLIGIDPARRSALAEQMMDSCPMLDRTKLRLAGEPNWTHQQNCLLMMQSLGVIPERAFSSNTELFSLITDLSWATIRRRHNNDDCSPRLGIDHEIAKKINSIKPNFSDITESKEYTILLYRLATNTSKCLYHSQIAAINSIIKYRSFISVIPNHADLFQDSFIYQMIYSWDNPQEKISKEEIDKLHSIIKDIMQLYAELLTSENISSDAFGKITKFIQNDNTTHPIKYWSNSAGTAACLRPMLSRIPKADAVAVTQKAFQELLKLPDEQQVSRELIELFVSQWEVPEVAAAFDVLIQQLDKTDAEVAYPDKLTVSLSTLLARLGDRARVPAMRKLVTVLTHRCAEEALFRRVKFQKYSQLTKLMSELAQRLTDAEAPEFLEIWWQLYLSEQRAIYLGTERPPVTSLDVIYDKSESESLRIENIETIWTESPLLDKLAAFAVALKPGVSDVIAELQQKLQEQPDLGPGLRNYYERRIHFLGNLLPSAQRRAAHQSLVTALGRPSLDMAKGYDALTRTQCTNIKQVITDSYDHVAAILRQYNPFALPCLADVSEADARYLLFEFLTKDAANKLLALHPNDAALSTLITAARCSRADCLDPIFFIMQQSSYPVQRKSDAEAEALAHLFWQKSWTAVLKLLPKEAVQDFLEARIAALPDPKRQAMDRVTSFAYDRDVGLLFGLLRALSAMSGELSPRPRIADFCAAQAGAPDWHANNRKGFLRCQGAENARLMFEELYRQSWDRSRRADSPLWEHASVILRHLEPLPADREWMQKYINLIKSLTSSDGMRDALLTRVEQLTGQRFQGDPFKLGEWARTQGYDVRTPYP